MTWMNMNCRALTHAAFKPLVVLLADSVGLFVPNDGALPRDGESN
jgi:hypothetical protein